MADVTFVSIGTPTAATSANTDSVGFLSHNGGDLLIIEQTYNNGDNTGFIDTIPAGFTRAPNGQSKQGNATSLQSLFYKIDTAGTTTTATYGKTATTATSTMTAVSYIFRGTDQGTPFATGPSAVNSAAQGAGPTVIAMTFPAVPAGSMMAVFACLNSTSGSDITVAWSNGFTTIQSASATNVRFRAAYRGTSTAITGTTATQVSLSGAKFFSTVGLVLAKTSAILSTTNGVTTVTSTEQTLVPGDTSATSKEAALNDTDPTSGVTETLSGVGAPVVLQMDPIATPTGTQGYTISATVDRDGGSSGSWKVELMDGGVSRGSANQPSNGTSTETLTFVFSSAICATIASPSTYWSTGPVIKITPTVNL